MMHKKIQGIIYVLLGAASYGLVSPFVKLAYNQGISYPTMSVGMMTVGMIFFSILFLWKRKTVRLKWKEEIIPLLAIGVVGLGFTTLFLNKALETLGASLSIVLLFQFTWMVLLLDYFIAGNRPGKWKWIATALIVIGTSLSVQIWGVTMASISWSGMLFAFLSAISYAVFLYFVGRVAPLVEPTIKSAVMTTGSFVLILVLFFPFMGDVPDWEGLLFWSLIIGIIGPILPTLLFNFGSPLIGGALTGMLGAMELPVAVVASSILLGEEIHGIQWVGIGLILIGIAGSEKE
jgi:drug/metabolite transporter (DMT)-like permease